MLHEDAPLSPNLGWCLSACHSVSWRDMRSFLGTSLRLTAPKSTSFVMMLLSSRRVPAWMTFPVRRQGGPSVGAGLIQVGHTLSPSQSLRRQDSIFSSTSVTLKARARWGLQALAAESRHGVLVPCQSLPVRPRFCLFPSQRGTEWFKISGWPPLYCAKSPHPAYHMPDA